MNDDWNHDSWRPRWRDIKAWGSLFLIALGCCLSLHNMWRHGLPDVVRVFIAMNINFMRSPEYLWFLGLFLLVQGFAWYEASRTEEEAEDTPRGRTMRKPPARPSRQTSGTTRQNTRGKGSEWFRRRQR